MHERIDVASKISSIDLLIELLVEFVHYGLDLLGILCVSEIPESMHHEVVLSCRVHSTQQLPVDCLKYKLNTTKPI